MSGRRRGRRGGNRHVPDFAQRLQDSHNARNGIENESTLPVINLTTEASSTSFTLSGSDTTSFTVAGWNNVVSNTSGKIDRFENESIERILMGFVTWMSNLKFTVHFGEGYTQDMGMQLLKEFLKANKGYDDLDHLFNGLFYSQVISPSHQFSDLDIDPQNEVDNSSRLFRNFEDELLPDRPDYTTIIDLQGTQIHGNVDDELNLINF